MIQNSETEISKGLIKFFLNEDISVTVRALTFEMTLFRHPRNHVTSLSASPEKRDDRHFQGRRSLNLMPYDCQYDQAQNCPPVNYTRSSMSYLTADSFSFRSIETV